MIIKNELSTRQQVSWLLIQKKSRSVLHAFGSFFLKIWYAALRTATYHQKEKNTYHQKEKNEPQKQNRQ